MLNLIPNIILKMNCNLPNIIKLERDADSRICEALLESRMRVISLSYLS